MHVHHYAVMFVLTVCVCVCVWCACVPLCSYAYLLNGCVCERVVCMCTTMQLCLLTEWVCVRACGVHVHHYAVMLTY